MGKGSCCLPFLISLPRVLCYGTRIVLRLRLRLLGGLLRLLLNVWIRGLALGIVRLRGSCKRGSNGEWTTWVSWLVALTIIEEVFLVHRSW